MKVAAIPVVVTTNLCAGALWRAITRGIAEAQRHHPLTDFHGQLLEAVQRVLGEHTALGKALDRQENLNPPAFMSRSHAISNCFETDRATDASVEAFVALGQRLKQ